MTKKRKKQGGAGLGSENSQLIALDIASPIDHYVKDICGIQGYGRYMDDGYVISESLEMLHCIKDSLYKIAEFYGLRMSDKKNIITPFRHHGFCFLKMRMRLSERGISMKIGRKSIRAARRKLLVFKKWVKDGTMDKEDAFASYQSWRAHAKRARSNGTLLAMDWYFVNMFKDELFHRKKRFPCTMIAIFENNGWRYIRP